ncbi:hypothetical protein CRG98_015299 [Punica granatum]|uniref:DDE Tnp4 domain-containing protein n=1 Tax=Punica granatum TaxID=22663 RepID=A0A2I0K701_PUNGR|nr:hypothetical protein CRG98_015299 [Punica granatum]
MAVLNKLRPELSIEEYLVASDCLSKDEQTRRLFMCFVDDARLPWNCIGAIDGTHVAACVPSSVSGAYCDQNNEITQNVLAAYSHDMMFTHVVTGWEGSAHDSRLLSDAATLQSFPAPYGEQYYVVDAGFPNIPGYMAPYKGQRYEAHQFDFEKVCFLV